MGGHGLVDGGALAEGGVLSCMVGSCLELRILAASWGWVTAAARQVASGAASSQGVVPVHLAALGALVRAERLRVLSALSRAVLVPLLGVGAARAIRGRRAPDYDAAIPISVQPADAEVADHPSVLDFAGAMPVSSASERGEPQRTQWPGSVLSWWEPCWPPEGNGRYTAKFLRTPWRLEGDGCPGGGCPPAR